MCGFLCVKYLSKSINKLSENDFRNFLSRMDYRGPDNANIYIENEFYLGHVRLSIVGLSTDFNQPYGSMDSNYKLLFNGEIYNFKQIDKEVKSDTKLLHYLFESGNEVIEVIRGMFSIGVYNKLHKEITFYRDFFGEKPLYYFKNNDIFIASSTILTIKELLEYFGIEVTLNIDKIEKDYLLFGFIREPKTIYNEINVLPAGHQLNVNSSNYLSICKCDFKLGTKNHRLSYSLCAMSSTDVKKNLLVSSGLDSAMLLHLAKLDGDNQTAAIIYKSPNKEVDESEAATSNVKRILVKDPIVVSDEIDQNSIVKSFVEILEQPSSDGLNLYNLLTTLKNKDKSVRLIYTGLGGDELYGGYNSFKNWAIINFLVQIPFIHLLIPNLKRFVEGKRILNKWDPFVYYFLYRLDYRLYKDLFDDPFIIVESYNSFWDTISPYIVYLDTKTNDALLKIKLCEVFDYMKNQLLRDNDNISMHFSIESRSPLLDPDAFLTKPDRRKWMKELIKNTYGIVFTKKKGFTYNFNLNENREDLTALSAILKKKVTFYSKKTHIINEWLKVFNI